MSLREEIRSAINRHSRENASNTPDFMLAEFLERCLEAFESGVRERDRWYCLSPAPGRSGTAAMVPGDAPSNVGVEQAQRLAEPHWRCPKCAATHPLVRYAALVEQHGATVFCDTCFGTELELVAPPPV